MNKLRPVSFKDFIGQEKLKKKIKVSIDAAKQRNDPIDHILLHGEAGVGKTSCATLIANEYKTEIIIANGASIKGIGDIYAMLFQIKQNNILFIDEIHRLKVRDQEILYTVMEDFVVHKNEKTGNAISLPVEPFTLIGATTDPGKLTKPMRDRFPINLSIEHYTESELVQILEQTCKNLKVSFDKDALKAIAQRSRGVPRIANNLTRRSRDFAQIENNNKFTKDFINKIMEKDGIDESGFNKDDYHYIRILQENYEGQSGLSSLAVTMRKEPKTVKEQIEPFLMSQDIITVTRRGREMTKKGRKLYLDKIKPGIL